MKAARPRAHPSGERTGAERRKPPGSLTGRLAALVAAVVVCWTVLAFGLQYVRTYSLAREAARLERHQRDLLVQNASLLGEIRRLRTDDQYIERLAREQLGMLRPGEIELVIVPMAPTKRHSERDPARTEVTPSAGRLDSAKRFLRDMIEVVRGAAERAFDRLHSAAP